MMDILQAYNWVIDGDNIICNTFRHSDYSRHDIYFPCFYQHTVKYSDHQEFVEHNNNKIIHQELLDVREATYGSPNVSIMKFYINTKNVIGNSPYFNGNSAFDCFYDYSRINPSTFIKFDSIQKYKKDGIYKVPFHDLKTFSAESAINPKYNHSILPRNPTILAFDIEVIFNDGGKVFVSPTVDDNEVVCISSVVISYDTREINELLGSNIRNGEKFSTTFDYYPKDTLYEKTEIEYTKTHGIIVHCATEEDLINNFFKFVEVVNPMHITGHNIITFDIKFLNDRVKFLRSKNIQVNELRVKKSINTTPEIITTKIMKSIKRTGDVIESSGSVLVVDFLNYVKKFHTKLDSSSLKSCTQHFLSWEAKVKHKTNSTVVCEIPPNSNMIIPNTDYVHVREVGETVECKITDDGIILMMDHDDGLPDTLLISHCKADFDLVKAFSNYTPELHRKCVLYCIHDTELSMALYNIDDVRNTIFTLSIFNNLTQNHVLTYDNNRCVTAVLMQYLTDSNLVVRISDNNSSKDKKYKAAYVQEPTKEFIEDLVLCYDIDSQYPNSFIAGNLSYETIVENHEFDNVIEAKLMCETLREKYRIYSSNDYIVIESTTSDIEIVPSFYVTVFDRRNIGVIPKMVKDILLERIDRKKFIASLKKTLKTSKNEEEIDELTIKIKFQTKMEQALKLLANSTYGFLGSSYFAMSQPVLARSCTSIGVLVIKHLINCLKTTVSILADYKDGVLKLVDVCIDYKGRSIVHPFNYSVIDTSHLCKDLKPTDDQVLFIINSTSLYTDTDSCFQQCTITDIINGEKYGLDYTKPNNSNIMKLIFQYGEVMYDLLNKNFMLGMFKLKFEKMMSYVCIIKKRYSYFIFQTMDDIDKQWNLTQSGGSLIQRSTNSFHKSVIQYLERELRRMIINSVKNEDIGAFIKKYKTETYAKCLKSLETNELGFKDFCKTRAFRKTKDPNNKIYRMVVNHNDSVLAGTTKSKVPYINLGERYTTILLVRDGDTASNNVTDHEHIIEGVNGEKVENMKIHFDHYWNLIEQDIKNRYNIWIGNGH